MTAGTIYRLPSGRLAECVEVREDVANFRYLNEESRANGANEVLLAHAHWAKLIHIG